MINALQRLSQSTFSSHRPFQPLLRNIAGEVEQVQANLLVICFLLLSAQFVKYVRYSNKRKVV